MTQKTIKALYKQPVNYKLIKDGYKTINGVIHAQDGMPKIVDLPVPSELYTTDLQYNVNAEVNGAPIITTEQFSLPDNEICGAKEYCYAPKGINYNYKRKQDVKYYDNFTVVGSPVVNTSTGIINGLTTNDYITLKELFDYSKSYQIYVKFTTPSSINGFMPIVGTTVQYSLIPFYFNNGSFELVSYASSNNSSWDLWTNKSIKVLSANTIYNMMFEYTGSAYIWYELIDNEWIELTRTANSTPVYNGGLLKIGSWLNNTGFTGIIDLSQTYIKISNEIWWVPYTYHEEEITTQIPGILDSSVTTDNWQQSQEYKLYQLKNQNDTDSLQLTEDSITDTTQKYKQYIGQLTIPARDYKWYYHNIPQFNFIYKWYANKSLYDYIENETYVDTLNFSDSWVNVTNDWKTQEQYINPKVCLMPIDGGETITTYSLNATEIGNINFNTYTGIVSEFNSRNAIRLNSIFDTTLPWELQLKFNTSNVTTRQKLNGCVNSVDYNFPTVELGRNGNAKFLIDISSNGSSWDISDTTGSYTILPNTDYWIRYGWTGTVYYLDYSLNGEDFVRDIEVMSSVAAYKSSYYMGIGNDMWSNSSQAPFLGIIDLSETYIKINDEIWWQGANLTVKEHQYITTKDTINITNYETATVSNGIISNITQKMDTPQITLYKNKSFEIMGKVHTADVSGIQEIFAVSIYFLLRNNGGNWNPCFFVNGLKQTSSSGCQPNSDYYIRCRYFPKTTVVDGTTYQANTIYFATGTQSGLNVSWTERFSTSLATYFFGNDASATSQTFIMNVGSQNGLELWKGSIDLKECYVKVDGQFVWKGMNLRETINGCIADNSTDDGTEQDWDVYYPANYSQPILVNAGQTYTGGTKVDTITIPAHTTWDYTTGGTWTQTNS